jgi:hypothetical protein
LGSPRGTEDQLVGTGPIWLGVKLFDSHGFIMAVMSCDGVPPSARPASCARRLDKWLVPRCREHWAC